MTLARLLVQVACDLMAIALEPGLTAEQAMAKAKARLASASADLDGLDAKQAARWADLAGE